MHLRHRGLMLILSSPSGAGKTTLSRLLLQGDADITMSVSVTTRNKRPSEQEGVDYYFVTAPQFEVMVNNDELLEYAEVFGSRYGTPRLHVENVLAGGRDVLFDIDWQGTAQVNAKAKPDVVSIFILPPSMEELGRRLKTRAQDSDEVVAGRMAKAATEISHWHEYDYVIINENIEESLEKIRAILKVERLRRARQPGLKGFVEGMIGKVF